MPTLQEITDFLTTNLLWVILIAAAVVVVVVLIVVSVVVVRKRKKRNAAAVTSPASAEENIASDATTPDATPAGQTASAANPVKTKTDDEIIYDATPVSDAKENPSPDVETPPAADSDRNSVSEKPSAVQASSEMPSEIAKPAVKPAEPVRPQTTRVAMNKSVAAAQRTRRPVGKWIIEHKGAGEYASKLCASNGEVMLTSEVYSSEDGARAGLATIIKATETGEFIVYRDKNDNFYYKLKSANNRLLCVGEIYKSKDRCGKAVESVKRIAADAVVTDDVAEGARYVDYTPMPLNELELKRAARGKWRVEPTDEGRYSAKLYANNGQLMLATEEVASMKRATDAIETVNRNTAQGNFIIDRDKFGRYYYKLRNAQKSIICIGEAYDKLDSCISAIESVRRFAATAE